MNSTPAHQDAADPESVLAAARAYCQAGSWQEAGELYRDLLQVHPGHGEANYGMGTVALRLGVPEYALGHFATALEAKPDDADCWLAYIDALDQAGRRDEARQVLDAARGQGLAGQAAETLARRLGKPAPARKQPVRAGTRRPSPAAIEAMANCLAAGNLDAAESSARAMARDFPEHWAGWKMLGVVLLQRGRAREAVPALEQAVVLAPRDAEASNNLGIAHMDAGSFQESEAAYRRALELKPDYAQAHCNLGAVLHALGEFAAAESSYREAVRLQPGYPKALNNLGALLTDCRRYAEAEACYRAVLAQRAGDAEARRNLGITLNAAGRGAEAEADLHRALEKDPDNLHDLCALAALEAARGDAASAELHLRRALELDGTLADAHSDLGALLFGQRRYAEAEAILRRALALCPDLPAALNNLGLCFKQSGRLEEAEQMLRRALDLNPGNAETLNNLGGVLLRLDRGAEAEALMRRSLQLNGEIAQSHFSLGQALKSLDRLDDADWYFSRAAELGLKTGRVSRAFMLPAIMGTRDEVMAVRQRFATGLEGLLADPPRLADPQDCLVEPNFYLAYHGLDDRDLQVRVAQMYLASCADLAWVADHCRPPGRRRSGDLRIGFFSRFLFNHSVSTCYSRLLTGLSRVTGFEVSLISNGTIDENIYAGFAGRILKLPDSLVAAREAIAALELDALIYLDIGMEPTSYFLAFARLAPLQCVLAGHPVTTGIPTVDCFLSTSAFEPGDADAHYSERLVRLPRPPVIYSPPDIPMELKSREALGLPAEGSLYMCPMKLQKLHPDFDEALARILELDPGGSIVLFDDSRHGHWKTLLQKRFAVTIGEALSSRIAFAPWLADYRDFVAAVLHADVLLDPYHFGIGSTVVVMGVTGTPQVTRPGRFMRGRIGAYYNDLLGVSECTVGDGESYARKAVAIATDPALRTRLAKSILRNGARLYDDARPVNELADFLRQNCH